MRVDVSGLLPCNVSFLEGCACIFFSEIAPVESVTAWSEIRIRPVLSGGNETIEILRTSRRRLIQCNSRGAGLGSASSHTSLS